jgi:hypothetical protein
LVVVVENHASPAVIAWSRHRRILQLAGSRSFSSEGIQLKPKIQFGFLAFEKFGFQQSRADRFGSKLETDRFGFGLLLRFFGFNRTDRNPYPA